MHWEYHTVWYTHSAPAPQHVEPVYPWPPHLAQSATVAPLHDAEVGVGLGVGREVGLGVGTEVCLGVGTEVGLGVGKEVGLGVGTEVGLGVGTEVGFGVGVAVGSEGVSQGVIAQNVGLASTAAWHPSTKLMPVSVVVAVVEGEGGGNHVMHK